MKDISLYVHIPFCKLKCFYCDFPSYARIDHLREDYVKALCKEIKEKNIKHNIKSIFIGGGTPSYLESKDLKILLETLNTLNLDENIEFTIECNPGTVDREKLIVMKEGGINRISMGLQAVQNSLLKEIGRIHSYKNFEDNFKLAREVGFDNINVDLMFGLPNQSVEEWKESLELVTSLGVDHISAYSLIVEEGTPFYKMWERDKLMLPSENDERDMYKITKEILTGLGYNQYEISNYSKDGKDCFHNKVYWKLDEYIGVGSASSSYYEGKRIKHIEDVAKYIEKINNNESVVQEIIENSEEDNMEEFMFMGLRLMEGIKIEEFNRRFSSNLLHVYKEVVQNNIKKGLLVNEDGYIRLTEKGVELSNSVMSDFIILDK